MLGKKRVGSGGGGGGGWGVFPSLVKNSLLWKLDLWVCCEKGEFQSCKSLFSDIFSFNVRLILELLAVMGTYALVIGQPFPRLTKISKFHFEIMIEHRHTGTVFCSERASLTMAFLFDYAKAHAHPTWTYWALPFFGRWVRRHFRDERLPNVTFQGAKTKELRFFLRNEGNSC